MGGERKREDKVSTEFKGKVGREGGERMGGEREGGRGAQGKRRRGT